MRFRQATSTISVTLAAAMTLAAAWVAIAPAVAAAAPATTTTATAAACAAKVTLHPNQSGIGGIVPLAQVGGSAGCPAGGAATARAFDGSPPLQYGGGAVMGAPGPITVTPIYWSGSLSFPAAYKSVINTYLANVAADSGKPTNVFATTTQYTAGASHIQYNLVAGAALSDANAFPSASCTPDTFAVYSDHTGYSACITDAQLQTELTSFVVARGLPRDNNHLYVAFLPKGVEACFDSSNVTGGGQCSANVFCAYHTAGSGPVIYANMPYAVVDSPRGITCSSDGGGVGNQSPNGNLDADTEISITSHEMNEAITDPFPSPTTGAWVDSGGNEIGDDCSYIYGSGFGGNFGSNYNQVINGGHYFTQEELSNQNFATNSAGACIQQEDPPAAGFVVSTVGPAAQVPVAFDATASAELDNSAANAIMSYSWNFGDASAAGSGATPSHTYAASGTYTVTLSVTDVDSFSGSVSHQVSVGAAPPAITSADHATFTVGHSGTFTVTATGSPAPALTEAGALPTGVTFTAATGVLTGAPAAGTVGTWPITVTATNSGGAPSQSFTLTVSAGAPAITWAHPADIVYGTALGWSELNAAAPVAGTFSYAPPAGTVLGAGANQSLAVTFTPTDTVNYTVAVANVLVNVNRAGLTVTADNKSRLQGAANPVLTYTVNGFVNGDPASVVTGSAVLSTTATVSSAVGTYPITVAAGTLAAANYTFGFSPGTLSVTVNHATFTSPTPGQANVDLTLPFTWTAFPGAQDYILAVGTTVNGYDLVNSGVLPATQTSFAVPALPAGRTLYATLLTLVGNSWNYQAITFTAAPLRATFTYPLDGASNIDTTHLFTWSGLPQAQGFIVVVGTTPYGRDLVGSAILPKTATSYDVGALATGRTLYASLFTESGGTWTVQVISFTAAQGEALFTYPTSGQVNVSSSHAIGWSTIAAGQGYLLAIGTTPVGTDVYFSGVLSASTSSVPAPTLPKNRTLYATLFTEVNGAFTRAQSITFVVTS